MHYLYYVGLDVSKETFDASLVAFEDANEMAHRKFANSRKGICSCLHWVEKRHGIRLDDVIFCAEDMGSYISEMAVCASDRTLNFNFSLISPLVIKYSMGIARGKTDRVDARRIAEYAITHYRKIALYLPAEKELCQLRTWLILRAHLAKQRVAKLVLLEKLDYKEKFADVSIQRSMLQEEIAYAETHMKTIEREMKELIAADSNICRNYKLLTSIKGVGPITAIVMLCSTLNFTKITDHRKFACYCGLAPFEHSSGTSVRGGCHTSSMANRDIKVQLNRSALIAIRCDPQLKAYYERKVAEGKHKIQRPECCEGQNRRQMLCRRKAWNTICSVADIIRHTYLPFDKILRSFKISKSYCRNSPSNWEPNLLIINVLSFPYSAN